MDQDEATVQTETGGGGNRHRPPEVTLGDEPDRHRRNRRLREEMERVRREAERREDELRQRLRNR